MGGLGDTGAPSRDSVHAGAQGQTYQVRVEPKDPVVPFGEPLVVNCSLDCPRPGLISLETALSKELHSRGLGWAAFRLTNVTGDMEILCSGLCPFIAHSAEPFVDTGFRLVTVVPRGASVGLHVGGSWRTSAACSVRFTLLPAPRACQHLVLSVFLILFAGFVFTLQTSWSDAWLC